jgi:hypothetical protein
MGAVQHRDLRGVRRRGGEERAEEAEKEGAADHRRPNQPTFRP